MWFVETSIENVVEVKESTPSDEFGNLGFRFRVHTFVALWIFGCCQANGGFWVRIINEFGVSSSKEQGRDDRVLPVDDALYFVCLGTYKNIAWGEIYVQSV